MADNAWRIGELVVEKFSLINPVTGNRVTSGAIFQPTAHDPLGADISNQITVVADGSPNVGLYTYSFTPALPGVYVVSVYETTTKGYIDSVFRVGGTVFDRVMNIVNKGQDATLSFGSGNVAYTNTLTLAGIPQGNVTVFAYKAQDALAPDTSAIVDLSTVIAKTVTDGAGNFTLQLNVGYYVIHYSVGGVFNQNYIRWSTIQSQWITSASPIAPS